MPVDYRKRTSTARPTTTGTTAARKELRYWVDQYEQLSGQLEAAQVTNHDQWRKEKVSTRELYTRRAAAAARMAHFADVVLRES